MDNQILVEKNIIEGKELIEALYNKKLDIKAAMWMTHIFTGCMFSALFYLSG
jgi:hypothetical protein